MRRAPQEATNAAETGGAPRGPLPSRSRSAAGGPRGGAAGGEWRPRRRRARLMRVSTRGRESHGDQASSEESGYALTQIGRFGAAPSRRCQAGPANGAGGAIRRLALQKPIMWTADCNCDSGCKSSGRARRSVDRDQMSALWRRGPVPLERPERAEILAQGRGNSVNRARWRLISYCGAAAGATAGGT